MTSAKFLRKYLEQTANIAQYVLLDELIERAENYTDIKEFVELLKSKKRKLNEKNLEGC